MFKAKSPEVRDAIWGLIRQRLAGRAVAPDARLNKSAVYRQAVKIAESASRAP
jgi:hypothetical protein